MAQIVTYETYFFHRYIKQGAVILADERGCAKLFSYWNRTAPRWIYVIVGTMPYHLGKEKEFLEEVGVHYRHVKDGATGARVRAGIGTLRERA